MADLKGRSKDMKDKVVGEGKKHTAKQQTTRAKKQKGKHNH